MPAHPTSDLHEATPEAESVVVRGHRIIRLRVAESTMSAIRQAHLSRSPLGAPFSVPASVTEPRSPIAPTTGTATAFQWQQAGYRKPYLNRSSTRSPSSHETSAFPGSVVGTPDACRINISDPSL
jgi:hypothetical protein